MTLPWVRVKVTSTCSTDATDSVIWEYTFEKEMNAAAITDIDNSGRRSIVVGGNNHILTFFNSQGSVLHEFPVDARVISITAGDIDGDNSNEIIIGCGDKTLRVFENQKRSAENIALKWRGNV